MITCYLATSLLELTLPAKIKADMVVDYQIDNLLIGHEFLVFIKILRAEDVYFAVYIVMIFTILKTALP